MKKYKVKISFIDADGSIITSQPYSCLALDRSDAEKIAYTFFYGFIENIDGAVDVIID